MRMMLRIVLFTAGLCALLVGLTMQQGRQNPAEAYWEIGSTYYGNDEEIYRVIRPNATPVFILDAYGYPITQQGRQLRLTNNPGTDTEPAWSPNGKWIVYVTQIGDTYYLYRMAAGGAERKNLGEISSPYAARGWSLDSEWVIVYSGGGFSAEQFAVHLESGQRVWMNASTAPLWTQNSEWVVYTSMRTLQEGIWRMNPETGIKEQLTEGLADFATLSPDGQWIVFSSGYGRGKMKQIFRMRIDGSDLIALTDGTYPAYDPHVSPDNEWILFLTRQGSRVELYKMRMDGSDVTRLTDNFMEEQNLEWSPDGEHIYFWGESSYNQMMRPYQIDADGSHLRVLDSTQNFDYGDYRSPVIDLDWQLWLPFAFAALMWNILIFEIILYRRSRHTRFASS